MNEAFGYAPLPQYEDRDRLIRSHLHLVNFLTERMVTQVPSFMSRDDIASAAMMGLVDAASRYNPGRGAQFKTFAELRIRGAIMDEVRRMDWFSRSLREKQGRVVHAIESLESRLGRAPEEAEIASELGICLEDYRQLVGEVSHLGCVSLNETIDDTENGHQLLELLQDPDARNPQELTESFELTRELASMLENLSEKERLVISLYYYEELNQKEIADVLELSEGRISQLHSQALARLKASMQRKARGGRR